MTLNNQMEYLQHFVPCWLPRPSEQWLCIPRDPKDYKLFTNMTLNRSNILNVQKRDNHCFAWVIMQALLTPIARASDVEYYLNYPRYLNLTGMDFPVKSRDIKLFEMLNNISVDVSRPKHSIFKNVSIDMHASLYRLCQNQYS